MLSVTVLPSIAGVVYQDNAGSGTLGVGDTTVANVTINLFRDNGSGVFSSSNSLVGTTTSDANGNYRFDNLAAGTYWVQEIGVPGVVVPEGSGVQQVAITNANLQGTAKTTIDSFASTSQYVSGSLHGGKTGTSAMATSDAIGGHRNLYVQLTTTGGALDLGADSDWPGMLDFGLDAASNGVFWVNWDGNTSNAAVLNPTGLGGIDLTSQGTATGVTLAAGVDHNNGQLTLKVYTDAANWSWATVSIPDTGDGSLGDSTFIAFSSFSVGGGSGASFANVGAVQLSISGVNASDGEVGPIATIGPMVITQNLANTPQADLAVVKTAAPNPVTAGGQLTYTFTTTNNGPANATGVTLSDTLPAGVTYVSSSGQGTVTNNNGTLSVQLGNLADGASDTTNILTNVAATVLGTITNTVTVSGNQPDPNMSNNTSMVSTQVVSPPVQQAATTDLKITKTGTPNPVYVGGTLNYTLVVTNKSTTTATGVTVVDTLPTGFTYETASGQTSATISGNTLTMTLNPLTSQASETVTVGGVVNNAAAATIINTATVSSDQTDADPSDNTAEAVTNVLRYFPTKYDYLGRSEKSAAMALAFLEGNATIVTCTPRRTFIIGFTLAPQVSGSEAACNVK